MRIIIPPKIDDSLLRLLGHAKLVRARDTLDETLNRVLDLIGGRKGGKKWQRSSTKTKGFVCSLAASFLWLISDINIDIDSN